MQQAFGDGCLTFHALILITALGIAMILGMIAAEKMVALAHGRWRFSIRGLMLLTVLVSLALTVAVTAMRR